MPAPPTPAPLEPTIRARYLQRWLQNIARQEDPWRARFFARVPAKVRAAIEGATPDTWCPAGYHALLADVLRDAFGPARAHEYYRKDFVANLARPPFESLVKTGARVFGLTPAGFLRWAGRAYEAVFRDSGSVHGEVLGPGFGKLVYADLPPALSDSDAWLDSAQGSMYGIYDFLEIQGVVRIDKSRRGEGRLLLELDWTPRAR